MICGIFAAMLGSNQNPAPTIATLVNTQEFRRSLLRMNAMSHSDRTKYASKFMSAYQDPLLECGFDKDSLEYEAVELALAAFQHGLFDRSY